MSSDRIATDLASGLKTFFMIISLVESSEVVTLVKAEVDVVLDIVDDGLVDEVEDVVEASYDFLGDIVVCKVVDCVTSKGWVGAVSDIV